MLVWVNLHSVGLLGLVILGAYSFGRVCQRWTGSQQAPSKADLGWLSLGLGGAIGASLLTPHGIDI